MVMMSVNYCPICKSILETKGAYMKCPQCIKEGKRSKVYVGLSVTTTAGTESYYDEDGNFHFHDPNVTTTQYNCSNGHKWEENSRNECPSCKGE